eukprot:CCRYP_008262-RC/>CCRYP_008262-RC protein AED:0.46 eAED:1.00 QI:0/0/0/1/0/0/2/0/89
MDDREEEYPPVLTLESALPKSSSYSSSISAALTLVTFATTELCHVGTGSESSTQSIHTATAFLSLSDPGIRAVLNLNHALACLENGTFV